MPVNFWEKLKKRRRPILALAPLAGFTDSAFRQICKKYGADVLYSEMASAAALFYTLGRINDKKTKGEKAENKIFKNSTLKLLKFNRRSEKYYVVQLFGSEPKHFAVAAKIITEKIKPDGIDINFGCPVPKVVKQGAGCGLMKDLKRSRAVIEAVLENTGLPVSIKIRAQAGNISASQFFKNISDLPIAAVMIHGRTQAQGFAGVPDWHSIKSARQYFKGVILANGGINDLAGAKKVLQATGADGLGLARGVLGRPWLFKEIKTGKQINLKPKTIFKIAVNHATLAAKLKGRRGIIELRKHLVWYVAGLSGAAKIRERLVKVGNLKDVKNILEKIGAGKIN